MTAIIGTMRVPPPIPRSPAAMPPKKLKPAPITMIFTSISGVTKYYQSNLINFPVALVLAAGTVVGAQVGAYTSKKISGRNLNLIFGVMLAIAGANMILKFM